MAPVTVVDNLTVCCLCGSEPVARDEQCADCYNRSGLTVQNRNPR